MVRIQGHLDGKTYVKYSDIIKRPVPSDFVPIATNYSYMFSEIANDGDSDFLLRASILNQDNTCYISINNRQPITQTTYVEYWRQLIYLL